MCELEAIADRLAGEAEQPVLDWGCGSGEMTALLRQRGVAVEAFDHRRGEPLHQVALDSAEGAQAYVSGDPVALPFPDEHFASVLARGILEHVQYPDRSLLELRRVLQPGGRLFIYELPNRHSYLEAAARRTGRNHHGTSPFDQVYDRHSATELVAFAGFRVDRCVRANMLPLMGDGRLASRYANAIWTWSHALARVPILNRLASNLEIDATAL